MRSLFITYNGLTDHIGLAQVVPYLIGLAAAGHRIASISFEHKDRLAEFGAETEAVLREHGVHYHFEAFSEKLSVLGKLRDQRRLLSATRERWTGNSHDFIHCRSYVPVKAALDMNARYGAPFIFDMRGFWIDQRIEGRRWNPESAIYRQIISHWRKVEERAIAGASRIVVLTDDAKRIIEQHAAYRGAPVTVVPCSVSFDEFHYDEAARRRRREELQLAPNDRVIAYLGSLGSVYMLKEMLSFFARLKAQDQTAKLVFIGRHGLTDILKVAEANRIAVDREALRSVSARREEVKDYLSAADAGLCFITPTFSSLGVSATKVAEYLACGLPVLANRGIGDIGTIVRDGLNGFVLPAFDEPSYQRAVAFVLGEAQLDRPEIAAGARQRFDMEHAVEAYHQLYESFRQ